MLLGDVCRTGQAARLESIWQRELLETMVEEEKTEETEIEDAKQEHSWITVDLSCNSLPQRFFMYERVLT
jgi:hypothetical protein